MSDWGTRPVLVALATYNERDNLESLVREIHTVAPAAHVLITDDNSPDGTGLVADALAAADPRLHVVHRPGKMGLGTAHLGAVEYAIHRGFELLVTMDADSSHRPHYLPALLDGMADKDVMIGSRYVPGGGVENWPLSRLWMSRLTNLLMRLILPMPARDTSGGFRCYRVELLRRVDLDGFLSKGYSFQQEMLQRCVLAGARVGETPIVFVDRRAGSSKAGVGEIVRSLTTLVRLSWWARGRKPKRPPEEERARRRA
ncbi:MAG: polyprenol monophosphomannose synthase [Gemmataceae bacterium]